MKRKSLDKWGWEEILRVDERGVLVGEGGEN